MNATNNAADPAFASLQILVLDRIDPSKNMQRYYVLAVEPTLFGDTALVREWGRIGRSARQPIPASARQRTGGI